MYAYFGNELSSFSVCVCFFNWQLVLLVFLILNVCSLDGACLLFIYLTLISYWWDNYVFSVLCFPHIWTEDSTKFLCQIDKVNIL